MDNTIVRYHLDRDERTSVPSGFITLIIQTESGQVKAAHPAACTLEAVRTAMTMFYDAFGDIHLPENTTDLFDYEFIYAEMEKELTSENAKIEAERLMLQDEKDTKTAKRVLDMLSSQAFDDFYNGVHMDFIEGAPGCKSEQEMLEIVKNKFIKRF